MKSETDRFWEKVRKSPDPDGCWVWTAGFRGGGYGGFHRSNPPREERAHRSSYSMFVGAIPDGMDVLHRCDRPACVRPDHLFLGTDKDNSDDKHAKGRNVVLVGERNGFSKLTEDDVRSIRRMRAERVPLKAVAAQFSVSTTNVKLIVSRRAWKHVV